MSVWESRNLRASGYGVLIYWHVERKSMAIHSQLIGCATSEVAVMIEGVMRHGTTMDVEASYTDSHGHVGDQVRRHQVARLRPAPPDQADQQDPAVPPGSRRPRRLAAAGTRADPADGT